MPPPTLNKSNPPAVQPSESQISGPENTTGQDFIFSPRTTVRLSEDSESVDSDDSDVVRPKGKNGSKPAKKAKPTKDKTKKKRAPSKNAAPAGQPTAEKELVQKGGAGGPPESAGDEHGKQRRHKSTKKQNRTSKADAKTESKVDAAKQQEQQQQQDGVGATGKKRKKCCAILSGAPDEKSKGKRRPARPPKKNAAQADFAFETKAEPGAKKGVSHVLDSTKLRKQRSAAEKKTKSMKQTQRSTLDKLPIRDYSVSLLPPLFPPLPSFEPLESGPPPPPRMSKSGTKKTARSNFPSVIIKFTRRSTTKETSKKSVTIVPATKEPVEPAKISAKISGSTTNEPKTEPAKSLSPCLLPVVLSKPDRSQPPEAPTEPPPVSAEESSLASDTLAPPESSSGSDTDLLPSAPPPPPPPPPVRSPKAPRAPTKHITPPETTIRKREKSGEMKKKVPAGKKAAAKIKDQGPNVKGVKRDNLKKAAAGKGAEAKLKKTEEKPAGCCSIA